MTRRKCDPVDPDDPTRFQRCCGSYHHNRLGQCGQETVEVVSPVVAARSEFSNVGCLFPLESIDQKLSTGYPLNIDNGQFIGC